MRGLVLGALAGIAGGAGYLAVLGLAGQPSDFVPGLFAGGYVGFFVGAGLGLLCGLALGIATALRPPTDPEAYLRFVRGTCVGVPLAIALLMSALTEVSSGGDFGFSLLAYIAPGLIAAGAGWILGPLAVRRYVDAVISGGGPLDRR